MEVKEGKAKGKRGEGGTIIILAVRTILVPWFWRHHILFFRFFVFVKHGESKHSTHLSDGEVCACVGWG